MPGLLQALGARVLDDSGAEVAPGGAALEGAAALDLSGLHPGLAGVEVVVASDVDNPLLGERGAAAVYAPQKGADPGDVALLEAGLTRWAELVARRDRCRPRAGEPGAGAAGGVGFAALAVLGADAAPGHRAAAGADRLPPALAGRSLVVTGEGSLDSQTLHGKAPAGVAAAATAAGVPVVAVCGRLALDPGQLAAAGFAAAYPLTAESDDLAECLERPGPAAGADRRPHRPRAPRMSASAGWTWSCARGGWSVGGERSRRRAPSPSPAGAAVASGGSSRTTPRWTRPRWSSSATTWCCCRAWSTPTCTSTSRAARTWEGFASATRAAAAGGVTTIVDMPLNSIPPTTTVAHLQVKRAAAAGQAYVDVGFWGGAVPGNLADLRALHEAGVLRLQVLPARLRAWRSSRR